MDALPDYIRPWKHILYALVDVAAYLTKCRRVL